MAPTAPVSTSVLSLTGSVANASSEQVKGVTVRLRVDTDRLVDRSALAAVADSSIESNGDPIDGTRSPIPVDLNPGQSTAFRISVPADSLGLGESGNYQVVLEAQSDPGNGDLRRVGLLRTLLTWFPTPNQAPSTSLVTLLPFTTTPDVDSTGLLLSDELPKALMPDGRLSTLLNAGAAHPDAVTWLLDPQLIETVSAMTGGYRVVSGNSVVAGDHAAAARDWLATLRRVALRSDVVALPYAHPDDVALVRARLTRDVVRSITTAAPLTSTALGRAVPYTIAWPTDGLVDAPTLRVLADAAPRAVVLSPDQMLHSASITPSGAAVVPGTAAAVTAVVPDGVLSGQLALPHNSATETVLSRQRILAELAAIALESPTTPRTVVMAPPIDATENPAFLNEVFSSTAAAPWVRPTTLSNLLGAEPSSIQRTLAPYSEQAQKNELPADYLSRIASAQQTTALVGDVVVGSAGSTVPLSASLARAGSSSFRTREKLGDTMIASAKAIASQNLSGLRIVSKGAITLPGDTGILPITVSNSLSTPATITLALTANPSVRLSTEPVEPVTIPSGTTRVIEVPARVSGSEPVNVSVRLASAQGNAFGVSARLQVGSSATSRAATWVVAAAFVVLIALLAVNAIRRFRQGRGAASESAHADETMHS